MKHIGKAFEYFTSSGERRIAVCKKIEFHELLGKPNLLGNILEITKAQLDLRICNVEEGATNTETYREFIVNTEREFGIAPEDLDSMNDKQLNKYFDFLDYLWEK